MAVYLLCRICATVSHLLFTVAICSSTFALAQDEASTSSDQPAKPEFEKKEEDLVAKNELAEAGKLEILSRFTLATPLWNLDGFETLNEIWAAGTSDPNEQSRLKGLKKFSPEWWREMDMRYGVHPPVDESRIEETVTLGVVRTKAKVTMTNAMGASPNCRLCHSTVLFTTPDPNDPKPKLAEGIPNVFLDFERLHQNLSKSGHTSSGFLFAKNLPRFFIDSADFYGVLVPQLRPDGVKPSSLRYYSFFLEKHGSSYTKSVEAKVPLIPFLKPQPWTNYYWKTHGSEGKGLYVDGGFTGNVADVTYAMAINRDHLGKDYLEARETFKKTVPYYFSSLKTPRYPFIESVDEKSAEDGFKLFRENCANCHGDFEKTADKQYNLVSFPGKLVDPSELGTDPLRINNIFDMNIEEKKKFLSGTVVSTQKYVAPPLHGIWARGPYLHNASVPTLYDLLHSASRPKKYSMVPSSTDPNNFDQKRVGWKYVDQSEKSHDEILQMISQDTYIRVFDPDWRTAKQWKDLSNALSEVKGVPVDPSKPELYTGMLNTGHTFGDELSEDQRQQLLDFLKCL
jgi:hypothetical protein